jgi:hypothetical protein
MRDKLLVLELHYRGVPRHPRRDVVAPKRQLGRDAGAGCPDLDILGIETSFLLEDARYRATVTTGCMTLFTT